MSRFRTLGALTLASVLLAPAIGAQAAKSALPPLIDRELFFGNPEVSAAQISPDGRFIAFRKPYKGTLNVWVKGIDEPFEKARPVTADTARPVPGYFWTRDGKAILFVQDRGGDENYNLYAVDPAAAAAPGHDTPAARDLTKISGVAVRDRRTAGKGRPSLAGGSG